MKYYSLPADFKKETIDGYAKLNNNYSGAKVQETYGNITLDNVYVSGRSADVLPELYMNRLRIMLSILGKMGLALITL